MKQTLSLSLSIYIYIYIFTKPSAQTGCYVRSIIKKVLTGFNSVFFLVNGFTIPRLKNAV